MAMIMMMAVMVILMAAIAVVVGLMGADVAETKAVAKMLRTVADKAISDEEANGALEVMAVALAVA